MLVVVLLALEVFAHRAHPVLLVSNSRWNCNLQMGQMLERLEEGEA